MILGGCKLDDDGGALSPRILARNNPPSHAKAHADQDKSRGERFSNRCHCAVIPRSGSGPFPISPDQPRLCFSDPTQVRVAYGGHESGQFAFANPVTENELEAIELGDDTMPTAAHR